MSVPPTLKQVKDPKTGEEYYTWKNDLLKGEKYWNGWFKGLSQAFLTSTKCKLYLTADKIRLDKDLLIAQMEGKFRLVCFPNDVGHNMMEDSPKDTAVCCHSLLRRFKVPMNMDDVEKLKELGAGKFMNKVKDYWK